MVLKDLVVAVLGLATALARAGAPETVPVGDPGNQADVTGFGHVPYAYRMGKYEVTNAQYCAFLNAVAKSDPYGLYNVNMAGNYGGIIRRGAPGGYRYVVKKNMGNKPVNFVSWYDALRYANWLTNGAGKGGTETGTYTFTRLPNGWKVTIPDHAALAAGKVVKWALPTEDEWYKAAYYDPKKPGGPGYWPFAARGNGPPACSIGNGAPTDVGTYTNSPSPYGTFDQNGNLWEWNETRAGGKCGVRGGSFYINDRRHYMRSSTRYVSNPPTFEFCNYGFRVVALGGRASPGGARLIGRKPHSPTPAEPKRTTPATFYVSQSLGNDKWSGRHPVPTSDGTDGPWKSLARASTHYVPGDRILLKRGDAWNEELHPKGSGTPHKPILIASYGKGRKPLIDREDYTKDLIGIHLADQAGYKIAGIEFANSMTGIYAEYSAGSPTRHFIWIEDCYFHDSLKYGHYERYPNPRNIGLGICFFSWERKNRVVLADITIKRCVFRRLASAIWTNSPDNFNKNASYVYNFANMTIEDCLFEEGYQWQMGIRGVDGGVVRNCITHDIGRGFRAFNGVAGAMFFRSKNWLFEDSEWGFIDIGHGSRDGEAFDFEGNCDNMVMRNCLFHDTDGPCFLLCCYASDCHPNTGIRIVNSVLNGKAKRPIGLPRCEIINTTDWNQVSWERCRFYLSPGEALMRVMDPEKEKKTTFVNCVVKKLSEACTTPNLALKAIARASSHQRGHEANKAIDARTTTSWKPAGPTGHWLELDFGKPVTLGEFRISEEASSSVIRYSIELWSARRSQWVSCFNGRTIGSAFIAPIVARTTRKARLSILRTGGGVPAITEFEAYDPGLGRPPDKARRRRTR